MKVMKFNATFNSRAKRSAKNNKRMSTQKEELSCRVMDDINVINCRNIVKMVKL